MTYDTPLPSSPKPTLAWARRVQRAVLRLIAQYGDDLEFIGAPADQWALAQDILLKNGWYGHD